MTNKIIVFSCMLLFINPLMFGKSNTGIDSLLNELSKSRETGNEKETISLLIEISSVYSGTDQNLSIKYGTEAVSLAKKSKDNLLLAKANHTLGIIEGQKGDIQKSEGHFQMALESYEAEGNTKEQTVCFNDFGLMYKNNQRFEQALETLNKAQGLAHENGFQDEMARCYHYKGSVYWNQGKYNTALELYKQSLKIRKELGSLPEIAKAHNMVALAYRELAEYEGAVSEYQEALEIFEQEQDHSATGNTYNFIGSIYYRKGDFDSALYYYNNALNIRHALGESEEIVKTYTNIARVYNASYIGDSAFIYFQKAMNLANSLEIPSLTALAYHNLGAFLYSNNYLAEAVNYYTKALELRKQHQHQLGMANAYRNLATTYSRMNQFDKAFENYDSAMAIYTKLDNKDMIAYLSVLTGNLNTGIDTASAMKQYNYASTLYKATGNKAGLARSILNVARMQFQSGKRMAAFTRLQEVESTLEELDDNRVLSSLYNEVGNMYLELGNKLNARKYFAKAVKFGLEGNNYDIVALCSRKIAEIDMEFDDLLSAKGHINTAIKYANKTNNSSSLIEAYLLTYRIYKKQGMDNEALGFLEKYLELNEKVGNSKRDQLLSQYRIQKQLDEETRKNEAISRDNARKQEQLKVRQLAIFLLFIISTLVLILIVIVYNRYKTKKRTAIELQSLNATKDKFFSIIAHDLRNPLQGLIGISEMIQKDKTLEVEKIRELNKALHQSARQLYSLLENLLQWARSQTERIKYVPNSMSLNPVVSGTANLFETTASEKNVKVECNLDKEYICFADKEMITTVLRNLVSNAIKFSTADSRVIIDAKESKNMIEVSVQDSGVGMNKFQLDKLFRIDQHMSTRGTNNEEGTGLGLLLCKEFVEKNQGEISVESAEGKGTRFVFTIPKYGKGH